MKQWYAVHTRPRQENTAEEHLNRQGFNAYLPKVLLRKRKRDKWVKIVEPLFPRYLFIQVDPQLLSLAPVRSTLGVAGLVRFGHELRPVPDGVIACLKTAENTETHQLDADAWPHKPGDRVEVLEGPFAGLTCIFQLATAEERGLLLIDLLGRQNSIDVPLASIA